MKGVSSGTLLCYLCITVMAKPLTQITFDFASIEEPVKEPEVPVVKEKAAEPVVEEQQTIVEEPEPTPEKEKKSGAVLPGNKRGRKSLKDASFSPDLIQVPEDEILFRKQYYSIGEVAGMFRENQSLIRFWETEFDILQPRKNRKGDRFFRPVDIKNLVMIYDLLRRRKFTIEGAKDYLKKNKKAEEKFAIIQSLNNLKGFLLELKANL